MRSHGDFYSFLAISEVVEPVSEYYLHFRSKMVIQAAAA